MNPSYVPVVDVTGRVVAHDLYDIMPKGNCKFVFRFGGFYGDVRDIGVFARIAALPALVTAAQSAAQMIDSIHAEFQETGSGNAVVSRLKTAYRSASAIVETNYWAVGAIKNVDERLEVFHELDTAAVALVETARMAALQIEYLAAKFGASDWEGPVAAVAAAVELSEDVEAYFGSEALRKKFDEWRVSSAEALAVNLAKFSR